MIKELKKRLLSSIILMPITIFFIIKGSVSFIFFLSILFLTTSYEWTKMSKKNNLLKFSGIVFLFFSFYTAFEIRDNYNFKDFLLILTICIFTDIGGYIFGKTFKGPKLTSISPKKTYAGVFGGFLLSLIAGLVFTHYLYIDQKIFDEDLVLFLLILFISLISQIGDLIVSYFKRKAKIKDTGKIMPGHGGMLDRIDGMIFVFPICYLIINL
tara:strand:- start:770 stop:1405 length:636 start_codon:yes stop_codon:yes gene_type:complete